MNKCGTCKYFKRPTIDEEYPSRWDKYGTCGLLRLPEYEEKLDSAAYVVDGSDYHAALLATEDFGCTLWEAYE